MEIISYALAGELAHKDSMGNGSTIRPGRRSAHERGSRCAAQRVQSVSQRASALPSDMDPAQPRGSRRATRRSLRSEEKRGRLCLIASPDRPDGSVLIHQDARVYAGLFDGGECASWTIGRVLVYVESTSRMQITANDVQLDAGDALKLPNCVAEPDEEAQERKCWCSTCLARPNAPRSAQCRRACGPRCRTQPTTRGHSSDAGSYGTAASRRRSDRVPH